MIAASRSPNLAIPPPSTCPIPSRGEAGRGLRVRSFAVAARRLRSHCAHARHDFGPEQLAGHPLTAGFRTLGSRVEVGGQCGTTGKAADGLRAAGEGVPALHQRAGRQPVTAARARAKGHETPAAWVWLPFCQAAVPAVTAALACAYFIFARD